MSSTGLAAAITRACGAAPASIRPLGGGCINDGYHVVLDTGVEVFAKTHPAPPEGFFRCEADGMRWLADGVGPRDDPTALGVPDVVGIVEPDTAAGLPAVMVLEFVAATGALDEAAEERLGRGLARLHAAGAEGFGLAHDGFIGELPQRNTPAPSWAEFWRAHRLEPLVQRATDRALLPDGLRRELVALADRCAELCGPEEPPARLHGDLWSGNVLIDDGGRPWVVDPAAHGGHREVDLAMLTLFGGAGPRCRAAYDEVAPLAPGADERVAFWQLYPLLVHLVLFGPSYLDDLDEALATYR